MLFNVGLDNFMVYPKALSTLPIPQLWSVLFFLLLFLVGLDSHVSLQCCSISVYIIQLFHTFLCNSQNYHPRGAVDDPIHCCPRPKAEGNSAPGHPQHRGGDSFDYYPTPYIQSDGIVFAICKN